MQSKIAKIATGKTGSIYHGLLDSLKYETPHGFIGAAYALYRQNHDSNPSVNGRIFEFLVCETLAQAGVLPFYYQARFERVPNADFDVVLYHRTSPVVLTMKVSLRERYKQADLEGLALRQVYRRARNYLITLREDEAGGVVKKINAGDVAGLDGCLLANRPEYTKLIEKLGTQEFHLAEPVVPISGKEFPG